MDVTALIDAAAAAQPEVEYQDETDPTVRGSWEITSLGSADWALQRMAECEAEAEAIEGQYRETVRRLRSRTDELKARVSRGAEFFRFKLLEYAERNRTALLHGKKKSRAFLHGAIGWRQKGGRLTVTDETALAAWIESLPAEDPRVRVKRSPDLKAIHARYAAEDGAAQQSIDAGEVPEPVTIPPGMTFEPVRDEIEIKPELPERAIAKE